MSEGFNKMSESKNKKAKKNKSQEKDASSESNKNEIVPQKTNLPAIHDSIDSKLESTKLVEIKIPHGRIDITYTPEGIGYKDLNQNSGGQSAAQIYGGKKTEETLDYHNKKDESYKSSDAVKATKTKKKKIDNPKSAKGKSSSRGGNKKMANENDKKQDNPEADNNPSNDGIEYNNSVEHSKTEETDIAYKKTEESSLFEKFDPAKDLNMDQFNINKIEYKKPAETGKDAADDAAQDKTTTPAGTIDDKLDKAEPVDTSFFTDDNKEEKPETDNKGPAYKPLPIGENKDNKEDDLDLFGNGKKTGAYDAKPAENNENRKDPEDYNADDLSQDDLDSIVETTESDNSTEKPAVVEGKKDYSRMKEIAKYAGIGLVSLAAGLAAIFGAYKLEQYISSKPAAVKEEKNYYGVEINDGKLSVPAAANGILLSEISTKNPEFTSSGYFIDQNTALAPIRIKSGMTVDEAKREAWRQAIDYGKQNQAEEVNVQFALENDYLKTTVITGKNTR